MTYTSELCFKFFEKAPYIFPEAKEGVSTSSGKWVLLSLQILVKTGYAYIFIGHYNRCEVMFCCHLICIFFTISDFAHFFICPLDYPIRFFFLILFTLWFLGQHIWSHLRPTTVSALSDHFRQYTGPNGCQESTLYQMHAKRTYFSISLCPYKIILIRYIQPHILFTYCISCTQN